jgi:hypothetical protein
MIENVLVISFSKTEHDEFHQSDVLGAASNQVSP